MKFRFFMLNNKKYFEMVQIVRKDGVAGLWEYLKDQFADLKETVMDAIMDIIQSQVIQAGIKWIMGLMTPVGAFIKAAMAIIDVVKFFIQRAAQIMELVRAFTESIKAIASGNVGAVAKSIENALGKSIPVLIGFLASLLGISGLADKVIGVVHKIRARIVKAITKFWTFVKGKAKGLLGKIGIGKKDKDKKVKNDKGKKEKVNIASEDFSMSGKSHTLSFEDNEIYMESKKAKLSTKLSRAIIQVERYPASSAYSGKSELIKHQLIRLRNVQKSTEGELEDSEKSGNQTKIDAAQSKMERLGLMIQNFGDTYKLKDIFDNDGGEHKEFEPKEVRLEAVGTHKVSVTYHYDKEAHEYGQQDFTITISLDDVNKRTVSHINEGKNLVLKKVGSRGLTISAGKLGEYNYGLLLNSAHIIGDQFVGSGYKQGLNLILTSEQFNKQTMYAAEEKIQEGIETKMNEHKDKFVTFDLAVASTYQVLEEDPLIETLKMVHTGMTDTEKKAVQLKLQRIKQLPRRCETVFYRADIYDNLKNKLGSVRESTEHGDIWLNDLFKIK